jgi:prophage regulatory protein
MNTNTLRLPRLIDKLSISRSSIYQHISQGLIPPPIKIGERSVVWVDGEIEQILSARIRGESTSAIKKIVVKIVSDRASR